MALYRQDWQLKESKEFIENMDPLDKIHIDYYVKHLQNIIDKRDKELEEYREVFKGLRKLLG